MEEVLVDVQTCGGYNHYPICLYDFTTKVLDHDHLVFSTRHLVPTPTNEESSKEQVQQPPSVKINLKYVDWGYCRKKCKENVPESELTDPSENSLSQSMEQSQFEQETIFNENFVM